MKEFYSISLFSFINKRNRLILSISSNFRKLVVLRHLRFSVSTQIIKSSVFSKRICNKHLLFIRSGISLLLLLLLLYEYYHLSLNTKYANIIIHWVVIGNIIGIQIITAYKLLLLSLLLGSNHHSFLQNGLAVNISYLSDLERMWILSSVKHKIREYHYRINFISFNYLLR